MITDSASNPRIRVTGPEAAKPTPLSAPLRLMSIDALRGFDMFWIIGADALFMALKKLSSNPLIQGIANQLDHVEWQGLRFYDLIFPLFVFIIGVSLVFSLSRRIAQAGRASAIKQIIRRAVILYLIGLFYYDGLAQGVDHIRLMGVLQRLAICYLFAGLIFCFARPKGIAASVILLLVTYWALMTFVPVPGVGPGHFEEGKNLANYVDREYLPLRKWDGDHDPEGLLSTMPAIASCLLGVLAGLILQTECVPQNKKAIYLLGWGVALILLGWLWSFQFPIIKKIWTSSYVLVAAGYSAIMLAIFYQVVDVWKFQKWCMPFVWIGMNSITIYLAADLLRVEELAKRLAGGEVKIMFDMAVTPGFGDLVLAFVSLGLCFWFVHFLYKRKIFLRI